MKPTAERYQATTRVNVVSPEIGVFEEAAEHYPTLPRISPICGKISSVLKGEVLPFLARINYIISHYFFQEFSYLYYERGNNENKKIN